MVQSGEPFDARAAIGAYVFAADWAQAREIVAADPWYTSREAAAEMALLLAQARESMGDDPGGAPSLALFDAARRCLEEARMKGVSAAFADLAEEDARLESLACSATPGDVLRRLAADPALASERCLGALMMLAVRASGRQEDERSERIFQVAGCIRQHLADRGDLMTRNEAASIAGRLRTRPPHAAMAADIVAAERALSLLGDEPGSPLWCELQGLLGSFLLEASVGDRADNVARAERAYRAILAHAGVDEGRDAWEVGMSGLANALAREPTTPDRVGEACGLFEQLIAQLRAGGNSQRLAIVTGQYARVLANLTHGDLDARLEEAIALQREVLSLLENDDGRPTDAARWARAQHNLGAHYTRRRTGLRSQNVDLAVGALEAALTVRTREADPVGRARTLRGLEVLYAEWTGADSLAHGRALADAAGAEATAIESGDAAAAARAAGRASLERRQSALCVDLSAVLEPTMPDLVERLNGLIADHQQALSVISRDGEPALWAEWTGGLGRILGRAHVFGADDLLDEARACLAAAIEVAQQVDRPRLLRDLYGRLGELCHEAGDFVGAFEAARSAVEIAFSGFDAFATRESRLRELEDTRAWPLIAAYAALRTGRFDEAVVLAEIQRGRSFADLAAGAVALSQAGADARDAIAAAMDRVARLEAESEAVLEDDPEAELAKARDLLADTLGLQPDSVGVRLTDPGQGDVEASAAKRRALGDALARARADLRRTLAVTATDGVQVGRPLSLEDIKDVARGVARPLLYVMCTAHGGGAVSVSQDGRIDACTLDELDSSKVNDLLFGDDDQGGYAAGASRGDPELLRTSLERSLGYLSRALAPLAAWLESAGHRRVVLVPLGRLALLPIHAASDALATCSYAPSARVLATAVATLDATLEQPRVLAVGEPQRGDGRPLPYAALEARIIADAVGDGAVTVLVGDEAGSAQVMDAARGATVLHLACHGRFRPSRPLESRLLLAGGDSLSVADVFSRRLDLAGVRLVTFSACQTGNVEYYKNPDESLGFPAALLLAGVPSVVVTLWPVHDAATMLFFGRFYDRLLAHGDDPGAALEAARRWLRTATAAELVDELQRLQESLREHDRERAMVASRLWRYFARAEPGLVPFAAPEYWAGFVLAGI